MTSPIDCKHQVDGNCQISTDLAQMPVPIAQDACAACILQANPRTKNAVTCSKAIRYRSLAGMLPTEELLECVKPPSRGVGAELEILIEKTRKFLKCVRLGWLIPPPVQCGCAATRSYMNQLGIHGCLSNRNLLIDAILGRWKKHLPAIRFIPFTRFIVGDYITRAIERFQDKETTYG
jgi:hypothetical protein